MFKAVEQAFHNAVDKEVTKKIFDDKNTIWAAFDRIDSRVPKMKIQCTVHRSQLGWKSITGKNGVGEISHLI